jgi:hypothetical protein
VLGEDVLAELVLFAEPGCAHAGAFEAEVESSDAAEERADTKHPVPSLA